MKSVTIDNDGNRIYTPRRKRSATSRLSETLLSAAVVAVFWLGIWFLLALRTGTDLLLPSPATVFKRFFALARERVFWQATGRTLLRILIGYAGGVLAGTILAALSAWSRHAAVLLSPLGRIVKATPVASFIILTLVWLPAANIPSFIVFLLVTPIVWDALRSALQNTDPALLELARAYRFGRLRTVTKVYLPAALPAYLAALLTSLGLAWKAGIAAEVLCLPKVSIGRRLYESKIYLETPDLFAWTALVILLSVVMEALIRLLIRRLTARQTGDRPVSELPLRGEGEVVGDAQISVSPGNRSTHTIRQTGDRPVSELPLRGEGEVVGDAEGGVPQ